jgi:hypothetical protein
MIECFAKATLLVSGFALLIGVVANFLYPVQAEETRITIDVSEGALSLTVNNSGPCSSYDTANSILNIDVINGSIASNCLTVITTTNSVAGYTLTVAGPEDLTGKENLVIKSTAGTMESPTVFANQNAGGAWGFAIPNGQVQGLELGFDNSYQVLAKNNTTNTAKYAAVPTTSVPFSITETPNTTPDIYNIYFAVATGQNIPIGAYNGMVTISGSVNIITPLHYDCYETTAGFSTGCTDDRITVALPDGMVPVRYTGTPGAPEWTVTSPNDRAWYNYANREWANAVTFQTPENRNLPAGIVLNQTQLDDILGYWVYIPRFEYRPINDGFDGESHCWSDNPQFCPQAFDVRFIDVNADPVWNWDSEDYWYTHPGFEIEIEDRWWAWNSSERVAGLWVAKYEASLNKGDGTNCVAAGCNVTLDPNEARASTFVPLASTWTGINLLNIHQNAQNIPAMHGINYSSQDDFMVNGLTNASWGAAVYLSQSLYGICTNRYCSHDGAQILTADGPNMQKIHNNGYFSNLGAGALQTTPRFFAGCGPDGTVQNPTDSTYADCAGREWHTEIGVLASSTHNATGIFDLAGGVWEATFSARANPGDNTTFTNWRTSGLNANDFNFNRFSDLLYYNSSFENCINCNDWQPIKFGSFANFGSYFGLALAETVAQNNNPASHIGSWGRDRSNTPTVANPWFVRGGHSNNITEAGVFAFSRFAGSANTDIGWRAVIAGS